MRITRNIAVSMNAMLPNTVSSPIRRSRFTATQIPGIEERRTEPGVEEVEHDETDGDSNGAGTPDQDEDPVDDIRDDQYLQNVSKPGDQEPKSSMVFWSRHTASSRESK